MVLDLRRRGVGSCLRYMGAPEVFAEKPYIFFHEAHERDPAETLRCHKCKFGRMTFGAAQWDESKTRQSLKKMIVLIPG